MFRQLKKTLVATVIASLTLGSILPAFADSADTLPDMVPLQEARFPSVRKCRWGITTSASSAAARR
ncbi:Uncharacterised protein [Raoultella terrigena]|uniref:Uncharacterized protein n=1 Tax=Raoultella terrigena TaxID=577 RepID=A0A3P8LZ80_RAOTE|nr:Uncharacterised protein [Raoultella terrigena]